MKSFGERVYYGDPSQGHRDAWLTDDPRLREHLPSDTEKRVERAYKQWNKVLRNRLGSETRLRLTIDDDQIAIPVKIVDGLPAPFAHVIREFDPDLWWLTAHRTLFSVTQLASPNYRMRPHFHARYSAHRLVTRIFRKSFIA